MAPGNEANGHVLHCRAAGRQSGPRSANKSPKFWKIASCLPPQRSRPRLHPIVTPRAGASSHSEAAHRNQKLRGRGLSRPACAVQARGTLAANASAFCRAALGANAPAIAVLTAENHAATAWPAIPDPTTVVPFPCPAHSGAVKQGGGCQRASSKKLSNPGCLASSAVNPALNRVRHPGPRSQRSR